MTPCPSHISRAEAWRHPGDRPQVAVCGRGGHAARADQAEATSGPHLEPVAPPATLPAFAAPAAGSLQPQRAVPDHRRARPLAFSRRLSARKAAHTPRTQPRWRDITPAQAPRDGSAHSCGSRQNYGATSAAARRCPWQQQVPPHHPPAASASLSHATPPPMHTSNATSDPAATGSIRGDEASASTDHHNSSVKLHVFALCR